MNDLKFMIRYSSDTFTGLVYHCRVYVIDVRPMSELITLQCFRSELSSPSKYLHREDFQPNIKERETFECVFVAPLGKNCLHV